MILTLSLPTHCWGECLYTSLCNSVRSHVFMQLVWAGFFTQSLEGYTRSNLHMATLMAWCDIECQISSAMIYHQVLLFDIFLNFSLHGAISLDRNWDRKNKNIFQSIIFVISTWKMTIRTFIYSSCALTDTFRILGHDRTTSQSKLDLLSMTSYFASLFWIVSLVLLFHLPLD